MLMFSVEVAEIPELPNTSEIIEEFDTLDINSLWSYEVYIAQEPVRMWYVV